MPYIVYKGFVYYPYEYNIVIMGFNKKSECKTKFNTRFSQTKPFEVKTVCNNHIWGTMVGK